jgi:hypothetical protein
MCSVAFWFTKRSDNFLGLCWKPVEILTWVIPRRSEVKENNQHWSTLIFHGKKTRQGKVVVSTYRLVLENSGGCSLLLVGAREFREL